MSRIRFIWLTVIAFTVFVSAMAFADSHVRIVRLSSVEGQVQMDRAGGEGLQRAILNTPIVEGSRLVTGSDGLAEVEFENQSALRLTGDSEVKFDQLLMNDSGDKINQVELVKGLIYLDTEKGDDIYRVKVGDKSLLVAPKTAMRLDATAGELQVAVFKGDVQLENQAQPVSVHKKETLTADLKDNSPATVAKGTEQLRYDAWNKERQDYSNTYASANYGGPGRGYGLQDLNYYGDYFYAPGYGYVWQPYGFAGSMVNWSPYSNGAWMFSPGFGYLWASAYPWGWLPYHYGSWAFLNGSGWVWVPGSFNRGWYTNGFQPVPRIVRAPAGWTAATPPPVASKGVAPRTVAVGTVTPNALTVPGGRVPPRFATAIPGRAVTPGQGSTKPAAVNTNRSVFAAPNATTGIAHQGRPAHVYAPPSASRSAAFGEPGAVIRGRGAMVAAPSVHTGVSAPTAHPAPMPHK